MTIEDKPLINGYPIVLEFLNFFVLPDIQIPDACVVSDKPLRYFWSACLNLCYTENY